MQPENSDFQWDLPTPFCQALIVEEKDIDGLGHTNNSVYVNWCQQVGWAHSVALGLNLDHYRELDAAMVIRHAEYDYIGATYLGEPCIMGTWLTACDNRLTMERCFQLVRHRDGHTLLRAKWQLVSIKLSSGRARRMPEEFTHCYGAAVIPSPSISLTK